MARKESLPQTPPTEKAPSTSGPSSFFSTTTGYRLLSPSSNDQPDPDQEDVIWHEPEPYSTVITRKEHTRDPTSILSFREVFWQKNHSTEIPSPLLASRFATASNSTSQLLARAPPSAWAKPDVAVSMQAADGEVAVVPKENAEKLLRDLEGARSETSRLPSVTASDVDAHSMASSDFVDAHIRRGNASSVISVESDATIGKDVGSQSQGPSSLPPLPPPKDLPQHNGQREASEATSSSAMPSTSSSFAGTLASGLNVAMRFVMNNSSEPSRASTPSSSKKHHGLLFAEGATLTSDRISSMIGRSGKDSSSVVRCTMPSSLMSCAGDVALMTCSLRVYLKARIRRRKVERVNPTSGKQVMIGSSSRHSSMHTM